MVKTYILLAWRNIAKHRLYAALNVTGLFAGILFALLIGAYVWGELQVNENLANADKQYILKSEWKDPNRGMDITTLGPIAQRLQTDYPGLVANYYRWDGITSLVSKGDKHLRENIQLGDSTFLSMYGFQLLHGNATTALLQPFTAVITKEIAIKYFGRTDVVGETLNLQNFSGTNHDFMVTGVLKDLQRNSVTHLLGDKPNTIFIPTNTFAYFGRTSFDSWANIFVPSYIQLQPGASLAALDKAIDHLIQAHAPDGIRQNLKIHAEPLTAYYLQRNNAAVKRMLSTLSWVGLFILLMAVINFVNISISSSSGRMKEIGVRKVMGGIRSQLIFQFLTESFVLVLMATILAIVAFPFATPLFADIVGSHVPGFADFPLYFIGIPFGLIVLVSLLAGWYPAFALSSIGTVNALKGNLKTVKENLLLRKSLVGFQFSVALLMVIAAVIVTQQVNHFFSSGLGFDKDYIVSSQVPRNWSAEGVRKMQTIRDQFAAMPEVKSVSLSYEIPNGNNGANPPVYQFGADSTKTVAMQLLVTDEHYLNTYGIAVKSGHFFNGHGLDSGNAVINEQAVAALGYANAEAAIGQQLRIPGDPVVYTVKGVIQNFHFQSMQEAIKPMLLFNVNTAVVHRFLSFKLKPGNISSSIEAIQKKWSQLLPGSSFEYSFMDDTLKSLYATELQLKKAAYTATILSLLVVLLGVLALVSLSIAKRVKEVGIRKVLGASANSILLLFAKEFAWIMLVAGMATCPVAYVVLMRWLNNYPSRIVLSPAPFVLSFVILAIIILMVIALQSAKAAMAKPVASLKQHG